MAYTKAVRAAALPWNQRRERRAAASTSELGRPAACLNNRPKPRTVSTQFDRLSPRLFGTDLRQDIVASSASGPHRRPRRRHVSARPNHPCAPRGRRATGPRLLSKSLAVVGADSESAERSVEHLKILAYRTHEAHEGIQFGAMRVIVAPVSGDGDHRSESPNS